LPWKPKDLPGGTLVQSFPIINMPKCYCLTRRSGQLCKQEILGVELVYSYIDQREDIIVSDPDDHVVMVLMHVMMF
jgi:hypothetical protein